jgi:hypothetical protein
MDGLLQDLRYAVRTLRNNPAFVTITVLTLALGIGANLAIFTIVNTVLLQPLPFREPERLVRVFDDLGGAGAKNVGMSVPELEDLSERSGVFEKISALYPSSSALSGGERVERIEVLGTSPNYFEVLGATPALGRVYTQSEWVPGFLDVVVISDGLWKRQFGSDPHVIGRRRPVHGRRRHAARVSSPRKHAGGRRRHVAGDRVQRRSLAAAVAAASSAAVAWSAGSLETGNHARTGTAATRCVDEFAAADLPQ